MLSSLGFFLRKTAAAITVAGFLMLPSLLSPPAQAETRTDRLMERYQPPAVGGTSPLELGVVVSTAKEGWVTKVYFYKYWGDFGSHSAHVWSQDGTLLGSQDFVNETTGWQVVELDNPVHVLAGQTFTVSVYGSSFSFAGGTFPTKKVGPLTVIDSRYKYTDHSEFPQDTVHTNYAIDFNFDSESNPNIPEPDPGLKVDVYALDSNGSQPDHKPDYVLCSTTNFTAWTSVDAINHSFDSDYGGIVAGCAADYVMIHYTGYLTWPKTQTVQLRALADDGFFMTLDGETVIDDWTLKGCGGSIVSHSFVANKPQKLDAWFYEWAGGACSRLTFQQDGNFIDVPNEAYSKNKLYSAWPAEAVAPSKPRNVQASVSGLDINLSWDAPDQDGGGVLSGYTATASGGGQTFTCHSNAQNRSCVLNNLPAGTQYSITVVASSESDQLQSENSVAITATIGTGVLAPVVAAPSLFPITFGAVLSDVIQSGGSSNVPGVFSFKYPNLMPDAGNTSVEMIFTPNDQVTYSTVNVTANLVVSPAPRKLQWGQSLDGTWEFGSAKTLNAALSAGADEVTYSVVGTDSVCSIDSQTGELVGKRAGICLVKATVSANGNYTATALEGSLNLEPVAPGPPTNVNVNQNSTSATVSWDAPEFDGGSDLSGYEVDLKTLSGTQVCKAEVINRTCIFEGLNPGDEYSVEVFALSNNNDLKSNPANSSGTLSVFQQTTYEDPRPYEPINPVVDDPVGVAEKTVAAITLVSAVAAAGAAVAGAASAAGAAGAAGGAASSGASGSSSSSSSGAKGGSQGQGDKNNEVAEVGHLRHLSRGKIDEASTFGGSGQWGDLLKVWALPFMVALDNTPKKIARRLSRVLPLGAKIFADGSYLRGMFGSFAIVPTITAVAFGLIGVSQANNLMVLPASWVIAGIAVIGTLDVLAGFLGAITLAIGIAVTAGIHSAADIRFLFGIVALGVVPKVISGAFRSLRRDAKRGFRYFSERIVDYIVAPMLGAWAALQIVDLLPLFAGVAIPVEDIAKTLPLLVALGMVIRVTLEEICGRYFPDRMNYVQVDNLPKAPLGQILISTLLRAATFSFISVALVGVSWHLFVGAVIFILPNLLGLVQNKFPNSGILFHLMPQGLVNLCVSLWLGQVTLILISDIFHETPDLAKLGFVLLPIPSLILSILKLFGRHGNKSEPRFYEQERMVWFYRIGSLVTLYFVAELTHTINTTNLF